MRKLNVSYLSLLLLLFLWCGFPQSLPATETKTYLLNNLEKLKLNYNQLSKEIESLNEQLQIQTELYQTLQINSMQQNEQLETLQKQLQSLKEQLQVKQELSMSLQKQIQKLTSQLSESDQSLRAAKTSLTDLSITYKTNLIKTGIIAGVAGLLIGGLIGLAVS